MIKWADIPVNQRQTIAGLVDSSATACKMRDRFYKSAAKIGLIESLDILDSTLPMFSVLQTRLLAIEAEINARGNQMESL